MWRATRQRLDEDRVKYRTLEKPHRMMIEKHVPVCIASCRLSCTKYAVVAWPRGEGLSRQREQNWLWRSCRNRTTNST